MTKMIVFLHFNSIYKISLFSIPKSEGLVHHILVHFLAFVGQIDPGCHSFVSLTVFFVFLYLRGYKQFHIFTIPCLRKNLYEITHTKTLILHQVTKNLPEL